MSENDDDKTQVLGRSPVSAPSVAPVPSALLHCVDTSVLKDGVGAQIALEDDEVSIGRDAENKISISAQGVSRYHARVFCSNGAWTVVDLGSTNGTRVNNSLLELDSPQALNNGDTVAFGRACYKYQILDDGSSGAHTGVDLDLGEGDKTMIMRTPAASATSAKTAQTSAPSARPAPAASHATRSNNSGGINIVLWIVVVVAATALIGGGAMLLGM
jgi:predicted component of type VI protein secretion system